MRLLISLLASLLVCKTAVADMTPEQWESDLRELVTRIETVHPDPYHHISKKEFYKRVEKISDGIPTTAPIEIQMQMMSLVSLLRDRHTALLPLDPGGFNHWLPLYIYKFSDGFYITSATEPYKSLLGRKILTIGNTPVLKVFEATADLHPSDNDFGRLQNTYYMSSLDVLHQLGFAEGTEAIELSIEDENAKESATTVEAVNLPFNLHNTRSLGEMYGPTDRELFPSYHMAFQKLNVAEWRNKSLAENSKIPHYLRARRGYWYEYLPGQRAMYLAVNYSTHDARNDFESFASFLDEVFGVVDAQPVDKFIVDIRFNPGGDGSITLPLVHEFIRHEEINQKGRLFVLIGRKTYSAAQMIYAEMLKHTNALLVGEPAGAPVNGYGDPGTYHLTNSGMYLNISTAYWQMGHPNDESWYPEIDLPFEFSGPDYVQGRDRAMEYLLALEAPYRSLPELLRSSSAEEYHEEAAHREELFGKYQWWRPFDERDMRFAARELYDKGEQTKGELGFQSLVKQYPDSWRAWRDYAQRVINAGDKEKAKPLVEAGLKVNPGSEDLLELNESL